jgi:hypothetical protein
MFNGVDDLAGDFCWVPAVAGGVKGGQAGGLGADLVFGHGGDQLGGGAQGSHLVLGELQLLAVRPVLDAGIDH